MDQKQTQGIANYTLAFNKAYDTLRDVRIDSCSEIMVHLFRMKLIKNTLFCFTAKKSQ